MLTMAVGNLWGRGRPRLRAAAWANGKWPFRSESQKYGRHKPKTRRNGLVAGRVSWVTTRAKAHATVLATNRTVGFSPNTTSHTSREATIVAQPLTPKTTIPKQPQQQHSRHCIPRPNGESSKGKTGVKGVRGQGEKFSPNENRRCGSGTEVRGSRETTRSRRLSYSPSNRHATHGFHL